MTSRLSAVLPATLIALSAMLIAPARGGPECGQDCAKPCCAEKKEACADGCTKPCCAEKKEACADDCVKACCANLETMIPGFKAPSLWIGDEAPKLQIAQFIKGDSVEKFEEGRVYVVEFWATWCGPCVKAFPHLSEVQEKLRENVTVIGVNIRDTQEGESQGARIERVSNFIKEHSDKISYTVAIEVGDEMHKTWLKPAVQKSIPVAFIVDGDGTIAWIGHPASMDEPLEQIIAGQYDRETASREVLDAMIVRAGWKAFAKGIKSDEKSEAENGYRIGRALAAQHLGDNAQGLNAMAWPVLSSDQIPHPDYGFAMDLARKAGELTEWKDAGVLDTYAMALYKTGDTPGSIEYQTKAIELTPEDAEARAEMVERLEMFKRDG